MREESQSGRWHHLDVEITRAALTHAAAVLRSVARDVMTDEPRDRLRKAAQRLDEESHRVRTE
jgi:hypothetical protein